MGLAHGLALLLVGIALIILSVGLVALAALFILSGVLLLVVPFAPAAFLVGVALLIKGILELRSAAAVGGFEVD